MQARLLLIKLYLFAFLNKQICILVGKIIVNIIHYRNSILDFLEIMQF